MKNILLPRHLSSPEADAPLEGQTARISEPETVLNELGDSNYPANEAGEQLGQLVASEQNSVIELPTDGAIANKSVAPLELQPPQTEQENDERITAHLQQFRKYHDLACRDARSALHHMVLAGIALVHLKAASQHGNFTTSMQSTFNNISARTLRRYRKAGENYLSCAHGKIISAQLIRNSAITLDPRLCDDDVVKEFLQTKAVSSDLELAKQSRQAFHKKERKRKSSLSPASRTLQTLERVLAKMNQTSRDDFWIGLDYIRQKFPPQPALEAVASADQRTSEQG